MNRIVQVKDVAEINLATYKKDDFPTNVKYLDTSSLTKNKVEHFQFLNIHTDVIPSRAQRKIKQNTILYSTVRPNQEHYGIFEKLLDNIVVSTGFTTLDVIDNEINPKYLFYLLTQTHITEYLHTIATNSVSAYPSISPNDLGNLKFRVPELSSQQKIASVLSALDSKIELNNRINAELEAMAKTLYDYWFVQFEFPDKNGKPYKTSGGKMIWNEELMREIPEGWESLQLASKLLFEKGIEPGSAKYTDKKESIYHVNFIRVGDVDGSSAIFIDTRQKKYSMVSERDVIVTFDGSVGKVAFGLAGAYSGGLRKIFDKFGLIDNSLIYFIFKDERINRTIHKYATGSILLHAGGSINVLKIPYNEEKYLKYQNIILSSYNKMVMNKKENQKLTELRDWLLPMLMNGQVKVSAL